MKTTLFACVCAVVAGCAIGAPPGFSSGDSWTFPLVDPLADGRLVVPVMIHGHGPYLFRIDRDSRTIIDPQVAFELGLRTTGGTRIDDYNDTTHAAFAMELTDFEVGNLTLSLVHVAVLPKPNKLDEDGRRIHGILGRDFLADSLVFGFDRERGVAWLQTQQAFKAPPGAAKLSLSKVSSAGTKIIWQPIVEDAKVGGVDVDLHPTFAMAQSELVADKWAAAKLAPLDWGLDIIDTSGTSRHVSRIGVGAVTVGEVTRDRVAFAPYADRRFFLYHLDGTLGLDFFRPYAVAADWHHGNIYLTPREASAQNRALRLSRWGGELAACAVPGCANVQLLAPHDDAPTQPILQVETDPTVEHAHEIVVRATGKSGEPLPTLDINLPAGIHGIASPLESRYLGAKLEVVDASPFPRTCPVKSPCVMTEAPLPP